ncbi:MAG: amidase family protein, partial [Pseudomonadota bacterium]
MGSLRNPAGWTGTYGLRPTWGAVPSEPKGDTFVHQLSTNGPMARTPTDLERLLTVQAGPDPRQPYRVSLPAAESHPLRIAWLANWDGAYPMEPGVLDQCNGALEVLEGLGHEVVPCSPGFASDALWVSWTTLRSWQVAMSLTAHVRGPQDRALLKPEGQWELDRGLATTSTELHAASVARSQWFAQAAHLFERFDALALPTAQCWPFDVTLDWPKDIAGAEMDTYHRWMEVVVPASLIGLPALGMPAGFSDQGLPMGLQLIGPPQSDFSLIACAKAYHEAAPWSGRRPVLEP